MSVMVEGVPGPNGDKCPECGVFANHLHLEACSATLAAESLYYCNDCGTHDPKDHSRGCSRYEKPIGANTDFSVTVVGDVVCPYCGQFPGASHMMSCKIAIEAKKYCTCTGLAGSSFTHCPVHDKPMGKEYKETNPKDAVGVRKARWFSYLPLRVLIGVGLALLEGARKYGRHNYRIAGVRASVYVDAVVCGHLMPWMEGEDLDPDTAELDADGKPIPGTGANHIDKAIASLIVLRDSMYEGNWEDDRPPSVKDWPGFIKEQHRKAGAIIDRYKNPVEAFTEKNRK